MSRAGLRTLDPAELHEVSAAGLAPVLEAFLAAALDSPHSRRAYGRQVQSALRFWMVSGLAELTGGHLAAFRAHVLEGHYQQTCNEGSNWRRAL